MERNDRYYQSHPNNRNNRDEAFENYRDRYSNRHGNYYGMRDEGAEYRNVHASDPDANFGYRSGGPVGGYGASSHRGVSEPRGEQYHYGDPNPYMENRRNEGGGYRRTRGTGWADRDEYGTYGTERGTNYSAGDSAHSRYSRQDNSYRSGGQGRRYEDFNRDEKMYRGRSDHGYNMLGIDAYYDRGKQPVRRSDNDFLGHYQRDDYDRDEDFRYHGEIHNVRNSPATGNRTYRDDQEDYSRRSSRYRRPGETSGPDYSADSGASSYGMQSPRG